LYNEGIWPEVAGTLFASVISRDRSPGQ
jgi:hypothetical protein